MKRWFIALISTIFAIAATTLIVIQLWQIQRSVSISDSLFNISVTNAMDEVALDINDPAYRSSNDILNFPYLDSSINQSLLSNGIDIQPAFGVCEPDLSIFYHCSRKGIEQKLIDSPFKYLVQIKNGKEAKDYYIILYFTDRALFLLKNSSVFIYMSIFLIMITVVSYIFSTRAIRNQRKIDVIKTDFINNMTHELKTPISTIRLETDFLAESYQTPECDIAQHIQVIHDENERMLRLVEAVLKNSRMARKKFTLKYSEIDINKLLSDELSRAQVRLSEANGSSSSSFNANPSVIYGDIDHLSNAFSNLIDNAIKYSPNNPTIKISTHNSHKYIVIAITDNGIGIRKEDQQHIFENFYRVSTGDRHDVKGFGIGLSYVYKVIKAHKGKITVSSTPGKGTTFFIQLPTA